MLTALLRLILRSLIFHFTHDAGKPSPSSTKELHISTVSHQQTVYRESHVLRVQSRQKIS